MSRQTTRPALTPDQQAEADRIPQALLDAAAADIRELAELLATKDDAHTFGATEFAVRDIVHRIRAKAVETAWCLASNPGPLSHRILVHR